MFAPNSFDSNETDTLVAEPSAVFDVRIVDRKSRSYMKPDELAKAIIQADIRTLESVKGIGKKTAERIVVELKDKLAKHPSESNISPLISNTLHQDAFNALTALGINRSAAEQAIKKVLAEEPNQPVEELIKKALRIL